MENQERFYQWMLNFKSIHLASNEKMNEAYEKIAKSDAEVAHIEKVVSQ